MEHKNDSAALQHYRDAIHCLDRLITQSRRLNELRKETEYIQLQRRIRATIQEKHLDATSPNLPDLPLSKLAARHASNDLISINNLLNLLQFGQSNDAIASILAESELLRRQSLHQKTVERVLDAYNIAKRSSDRNWKSVTLLHLSAARISLMLPEQDVLAAGNCEQAIRFAGFDLHNLALAQIMRAQIELQIRRDEGGTNALSYFRQAAETLGQIIKEKRSQNQPTEIYEELKSAVEADGTRLIESHAPPTARHTATATRQIVRSTTSRVSDKSPKRSLEKPGKHLIPIFSIAAHAGFPGEGYVDNAKDDFLDITGNKVLIENKSCEIRWLHNKNRPDQKIQLQSNKEYVVVQVEGSSMEPTIHHGEYLLVKKQSRHDSDRQIVVAVLGIQSEFEPFRIIVKIARGYPEIEYLASSNSDQLRYPVIEPSNSELPINILGVVEAVLHPASCRIGRQLGLKVHGALGAKFI